MNRWQKAKQNSTAQQETSPYPTMHLRQVVHTDGRRSIEQLVEYRNAQNQVVTTTWVEIPTIYEVNL